MAALGIIGYWRTRDPLAPVVVFAPMLLYVYVYSPFMLNVDGELEAIFQKPSDLMYVMMVNITGTGLFMMGCLPRRATRIPQWQPSSIIDRLAFGVQTRRQLYRLGIVIGGMALCAYIYMVMYSGGPFKVYSYGKPFLQTPSGYIGELPMLAYPALILFAIGIQGKKIKLMHVAGLMLIALPHLVTATLGGRRGPAFLIGSTLAACWYIARDSRPNLRRVIAGVALLGILMIFLGSNRKNIYWGSISIDSDAFVSTLTMDSSATDDGYTYGAGAILSTEHHAIHYWGKRYFCLMVLRPIPKQIWPNKYVDMSMQWMVDDPGTMGLSDDQWVEAVGFKPLKGSAGGFVADTYVEFWWYGMLACFFIGRVYSICWARSRTKGGVWSVVYIELLVLSVYLPTQSVSAWMYRAMLISIPTWVVWRYFIRPNTRVVSVNGPRRLPLTRQ